MVRPLRLVTSVPHLRLARYRMRPLRSSLAAAAATLVLAGCSSTPAHSPMAPISLAVVNARVWTGDTSRPWAGAIAVSGDRLAAVGSSAQVRKMADSTTRVIDAHGAMLTPGF